MPLKVTKKQISAGTASDLTDGIFNRYLTNKSVWLEEFFDESGRLIRRRIVGNNHYPRVHQRFYPVNETYSIKQGSALNSCRFTRGPLTVYSHWKARRVVALFRTNKNRTVFTEYFGNGLVYQRQSTKPKRGSEWTQRKGPYRKYYKNGHRRETAYYRPYSTNGTRLPPGAGVSVAHGVSTTYEKNGNPKERYTLRRGIPHGWHVMFTGGQVNLARQYQNGTMTRYAELPRQNELTHQDRRLAMELVQAGLPWSDFYEAMQARGIDTALIRETYTELAPETATVASKAFSRYK